MCTGHAFTGVGRLLGRSISDASTLGLSSLMRRKCKGCEHPMSEHQGQSAQVVGVTSAHVAVQSSAHGDPNSNPARWVLQNDGRYRWWGDDHWTNNYSEDPQDPAPVDQVAPTVEIDRGSRSGTNDHLVRLRHLAELRDAGLVTEEEFAAKKAEILARM
jgi:hypothetical protein